MKKHYILALVASVVCGMSAQAQMQVRSAQPQSIKVQLERSDAQVKKSGSLLRSGEAQQLPDSIIVTDADGAFISKNIYKYSEEGFASEMWYYEWNAEVSKWDNYTYNTYDRDANGNAIGQLTQRWNGSEYVDSIKRTSTYDEQNRLVKFDEWIGTKHKVETYTFNGDSCLYIYEDTVFTADGQYQNSDITLGKHEYVYDEAGNKVKELLYSFNTVGEDNVPVWYLWQENDNTYDEQNRQTGATWTYYDEAKNVLATNDVEYTYVGDGDKNYTHIQRMTYSQEYKDEYGVEDVYLGQRQEVIAGNPEQLIYSQQTEEGGEWIVNQIGNYYYPQGSSVANETIQQNVAPVCKAYTSNGALIITTSEAVPVQVYTMGGACCYDATVNGQASIASLPAGIYIVKCQQETYKIKVK